MMTSSLVINVLCFIVVPVWLLWQVAAQDWRSSAVFWHQQQQNQQHQRSNRPRKEKTKQQQYHEYEVRSNRLRVGAWHKSGSRIPNHIMPHLLGRWNNTKSNIIQTKRDVVDDADPSLIYPDSHLIPANVFNMTFYVSVKHHKWVLKNEKGCLAVVEDALSSRKGNCITYDIGMNDGFYTQLFSAYGCHTWSFELHPECINISQTALKRNGFSHFVNISNLAISDSNKTVTAPKSPKCDGSLSISRKSSQLNDEDNKEDELPLHLRNRHTKKKKQKVVVEDIPMRYIPSVRLEEVVPSNTIIDLAKIDVEGHEPEVLRGAEILFREHRIRRVIIEIIPRMWDIGRHSNSVLKRNETLEKVALDRQFDIIERILGYGYSFACANMDWGEIPSEMIRYTAQTNAMGKTTIPEVMKDMMLRKKCVDWDISLPIAP